MKRPPPKKSATWRPTPAKGPASDAPAKKPPRRKARAGWPPRSKKPRPVPLPADFRRLAAKAEQAGVAQPAVLAAHEAGHALAAALFGDTPAAVTLTAAAGGGAVFHRIAPNNPEAVRLLMVMTAAGPAAARLVDPRDPGSEQDEADLRRDARRLHGLLAHEATIEAEVAAAKTRAEKLVRQHWPVIVRVAALLLEFHATLGEIPRGRIEDYDA